MDASASESPAPDATPETGGVPADGAGQTTSGDAGVCAACGAGAVCVEDVVSGGAFITPDDAGQCPPGRVLSPGTPQTCVSPPTYHCATLPAACNTAPGSTAIAHCACAGSLCGSGESCTDVTPSLMKCTLLAP